MREELMKIYSALCTLEVKGAANIETLYNVLYFLKNKITELDKERSDN